MPAGPRISPEPDSALIRAAGGLVWRTDAPVTNPQHPGSLADQRLVCLVHRPAQDDWTLPKGKLEPGEHPLAAAVREVQEEAGVSATPQFPLPTVRYRTRQRREKQVQFWAMVASNGGSGPTDSEVDQVVWLPVAEAVQRASYSSDRRLLRWWAERPTVTSVVLLVRHVDAGDRHAWRGDDTLRPVSPDGMRSADRLSRLLALFAPTRLVSATPVRCQQTLSPLSRATGLSVESESVFDEATADPAGAAARLCELAAGGGTTVVCSQGAVIPTVLAHLHAHEAGRSGDFTTTKGDGWCLPFSGPLLLTAAPLAAADRHLSKGR